jgi:hypothetical protein
MCQEGTNGNRNQDVKEQLPLGDERTTRGIYRKSTELEIAKRIARCNVGLQPPPLLRELTGLYRVSLWTRARMEEMVAVVGE